MTEHRVNPLQWLSTKFASLNHSHNEYLTNHQDISGKEDISSKVTSLSENSTNTQYPSAKCVYDTVDVVDDKVSVVYNTVSIIDTSDSVYDADRWTESGTMGIRQQTGRKFIAGGGNGYVIYDGNISNLDNYDITLNLTTSKTNTHVYINDNDIGTLPTSQTSILFKKRDGVVKVVYDNNQYDASAVRIISFNVMNNIRYTIDVVLYQGMIYDVIDSIPSKTSDLTNDSGFLTQHQSLSNYVTTDDSRLTDARTPTAHNHNDLYYTETETDNLLNGKSNTNHTHSQYLTQHQSLANYIQKSSTSGLLKNDGSVDTTQYLSSLPSHNHDDRYYTETEIDTALENKINKSQTAGLVKNDGSIMTSGTGSNNWTVGNDSRLSDKRKPIMTVITPNSSTDIDTYYTETGFYAFFNNSAVASMSTENKAKLPTGLETKSFYLVVENRVNYAKQTLTRYDNNKTWIRTRNADRTTPWSDWSELSVDGHTHIISDVDGLNNQLSAKAPTSHASSSTTYGVATASNYGHTKVINNLTTSVASNGQALNAYQGKVLNDNKIDKNDFNVNYVYSFVYNSSIEKYAYQGQSGAVGIGVSAIDENDNSLLNENGVAIIDLVFQNTNINYGSIQLVLAEADGSSYSYSGDLSNTQTIATISDTNEHHITVVVSSDTHIEEQSYDYYDLKVSKISYDGSNITVSSGKTSMERVGVYLVFNGAIGGNIEYMNVIKRTPIVNQIIDIIYPIGSTYISVNSVNPSFLFGGEWEQIQNRFLLASGSTYSAGSTGGSATVALTKAQMPRHNHTQAQHRHKQTNKYSDGTGSAGAYMYSNNRKAVDHYTDYQTPVINHTGGTGTTNADANGSPHENMPPYLTVYMWKRIA